MFKNPANPVYFKGCGVFCIQKAEQTVETNVDIKTLLVRYTSPYTEIRIDIHFFVYKSLKYGSRLANSQKISSCVSSIRFSSNLVSVR